MERIALASANRIRALSAQRINGANMYFQMIQVLQLHRSLGRLAKARKTGATYEDCHEKEFLCKNRVCVETSLSEPDISANAPKSPCEKNELKKQTVQPNCKLIDRAHCAPFDLVNSANALGPTHL
jgi:hypothetical protein|mmetsp:Transcript_21188/g.34134  ORF Transcript_21188/g.34134 Transcript_21188/m.34134 type:complete len:126 (+) Transcript_21188:45-422(+)